MSANKLKVKYFQRKPIKGFNYSLEFIFNDIRERLNDFIEAEVKISRYSNAGLFTKIGNIIESGYHQGRSINHITGEIHFINLLMNPKKTILTILDCGPMQRKKGLAKWFVKWLYLTLPIKRSAIVTTISEEVKKEIIKYTQCDPEKIKVIPVAVSEHYQPCPKEFNAEKPILLQVGTGPNKNVNRLIQALEGVNCHLAIVGNLSLEQTKMLEKCHIDYSNYYNLSQNEIIEQYKNCDIVAFISTFEGFGMPIVEANSIERVVVTSNISSMPEVAGDAALLVNPYDIIAIRTGILKVVRDKRLRENLINKGKVNRLRFNGDKIAQLYLEQYKMLRSA